VGTNGGGGWIEPEVEAVDPFLPASLRRGESNRATAGFTQLFRKNKPFRGIFQ
jgi:hypothetical protein